MSEKIRKVLSEKDEAREKMLPLCRDSIRYSSTAIRAVHRHEYSEAANLVKSAREVLTQAEKAVTEHIELASTGAVKDAQKELAEANITLALVTGKSIPEPEALGVDVAAYLNGLGEAVGEIRRYLLDGMRHGDLSRGEDLLVIMDDVYSMLVTMDFPDALTGGLRRTTDMVRGVLEKTRSDLTLAIRQKALENKIASFQGEKIDSAEPDIPGITIEEQADTHQDEPELNPEEHEIYAKLAVWRNHRANEENVAEFIIAKTPWLKQIIKMRPVSLKDLEKIIGFGERRISKYGKEIINIVNKAE
jgi:translin